MESLLYEIGNWGVLVLLVVWFCRSLINGILLSRLVNWDVHPIESNLLDEINLCDECTYTVLKHGNASTKEGTVKVLTLKQSYTQLGQITAITKSSSIYVLLIHFKDKKLKRFLEQSPNYYLFKRIKEEEMLAYQIRSVFRFIKDLKKLKQSA